MCAGCLCCLNVPLLVFLLKVISPGVTFICTSLFHILVMISCLSRCYTDNMSQTYMYVWRANVTRRPNLGADGGIGFYQWLNPVISLIIGVYTTKRAQRLSYSVLYIVVWWFSLESARTHFFFFPVWTGLI